MLILTGDEHGQGQRRITNDTIFFRFWIKTKRWSQKRITIAQSQTTFGDGYQIGCNLVDEHDWNLITWFEWNILFHQWIYSNLVTIAKCFLALGTTAPLLRPTWTGSKEDQKWQCRSHLIGWLNVTSRHVTMKQCHFYI